MNLKEHVYLRTINKLIEQTQHNLIEWETFDDLTDLHGRYAFNELLYSYSNHYRRYDKPDSYGTVNEDSLSFFLEITEFEQIDTDFFQKEKRLYVIEGINGSRTEIPVEETDLIELEQVIQQQVKEINKFKKNPKLERTLEEYLSDN